MARTLEVEGEIVARSYPEAKQRVRSLLRADYPTYNILVLSVELREGYRLHASNRANYLYYALLKEREK